VDFYFPVVIEPNVANPKKGQLLTKHKPEDHFHETKINLNIV